MGETMVIIKELEPLLGLTEGESYRLLLKGVFTAVKEHNVWRIPEASIADVCDRILRYRDRRPFYPGRNMAIPEAAEALKVTEGAIYGMGRRGDLEWAEDEMWKMPTRDSVNRLCRRKGLREVA